MSKFATLALSPGLFPSCLHPSPTRLTAIRRCADPDLPMSSIEAVRLEHLHALFPHQRPEGTVLMARLYCRITLSGNIRVANLRNERADGCLPVFRRPLPKAVVARARASERAHVMGCGTLSLQTSTLDCLEPCVHAVKPRPGGFQRACSRRGYPDSFGHQFSGQGARCKGSRGLPGQNETNWRDLAVAAARCLALLGRPSHLLTAGLKRLPPPPRPHTANQLWCW